PALLIVFDLLAGKNGKSLLGLALRERRKELEVFARENLKAKGAVRLSPATTDLAKAKKWFDKVGGDLDGVIAKQLEAPYASGERTAMVKVKQIRTADCVVGGFRYATGARVIGSLLLGLYDDDGLLHHVGFTSAFKASERRALTKKFEALKKPPGFTGNAPGGPSRWAKRASCPHLLPRRPHGDGYRRVTSPRSIRSRSLLRSSSSSPILPAADRPASRVARWRRRIHPPPRFRTASRSRTSKPARL